MFLLISANPNDKASELHIRGVASAKRDVGRAREI
jgi:hypothetical protein